MSRTLREAKTIMPKICKCHYINIHRTDAWYFIHINVLLHTEISIFPPLFIYVQASVRFSGGGCCWYNVAPLRQDDDDKNMLIYIEFPSRCDIFKLAKLEQITRMMCALFEAIFAAAIATPLQPPWSKLGVLICRRWEIEWMNELFWLYPSATFFMKSSLLWGLCGWNVTRFLEASSLIVLPAWEDQLAEHYRLLLIKAWSIETFHFEEWQTCRTNPAIPLIQR